MNYVTNKGCHIYVRHYAQNGVWKKLKPAGLRLCSLKFFGYKGSEKVIFKILTIAKPILWVD